MATKLDSKFMYLRFEHGLTEKQMDDLINEVITSNELLLTNSSNRDSLLYDLVVNKLTGTVKEAETTKEVDTNSNRKEFDVLVVTHPDVIKNIDGSTYASYAGLKAISHFEGTTIEEYNNYIQKRGSQKVLLDFMEEASKEFDGKVPAPSTVKKHIKKLIDEANEIKEILDRIVENSI